MTPIPEYPIDMDGDWDYDLVSALARDNAIAWFENDGLFSFTKHIINEAIPFAYDAFVADAGGDSNPDIISCAYAGSEIAWWENDTAYATNWLVISNDVGVLNPYCSTNWSITVNAMGLDHGAVMEGIVTLISDDPLNLTNRFPVVLHVN